MFAVLVVVCVGLAGDGWSYSMSESRKPVSRPATAPRTTSVPPSFTARSMSKFVEHSPAVQSPAPPAKPLVAQADGTWGPDKPTPSVRPAVKAEPPKMAPQPRCIRCGTACGCGDVCTCESDDARNAGEPISKAWWTLPEDPTREGYGRVVWDKGSVVLKYEKIRAKQVAIMDRPVVRTYAPIAPVYYPSQPISIQPITACGRPGRG
jgi:hypothetical protein